MSKNKKKKILYAIKLLQKAFYFNVEAHQLAEKSQSCYYEWDHDWAQEFSHKKSIHYWLKEKYYFLCIKNIKKYQLPIKYWYLDWIFYFSYLWKQISFHWSNIYFLIKKYIKEYKKYNWKRSHRPNNNIFPLDFYLKKNKI